MKALIASLAAGLLLVQAGAAADESASRTARLRVLQTPLLSLSGSRFLPGERVRVTVVSVRKHSKRVTATRRGAFVVRFDFVPDRCLGATIVAVGNRGSRAQAKLPMPVCPPRL